MQKILVDARRTTTGDFVKKIRSFQNSKEELKRRVYRNHICEEIIILTKETC
jgi:hypothetical protein